MSDSKSNLEEGIRLVKLGNAEEAINFLRMAIVEQPGNPTAHEYLGAAFAYVQDTDSAILELQEAVRLNPDSAAYRYNLGQAYEMTGDYSGAIIEYTMALRINPDYDRARFACAAISSTPHKQAA